MTTLPNLEQLRKRAKDLIKAHRRGERDATERLRQSVPKLARLAVEELQASRLALADAQHALALEHGFSSWPKLVRTVELARDAIGGLLKAALAGDDELVDSSPELERAKDASLHLACVVADVAAVQRSTAPVDALGGPLDATPLVHLCASRYGRGDRDCAERRVQIARILIERGADANASYADFEHFDGTRVALSAAAKNVGSAALLEVLVQGGAARHDHSALWATASLEQTVDDDPLACLKFMVAQEPPRWILNSALSTSVRQNSAEAVELLLDAGANPNNGGGWGGSGTLMHHAILLGCDERILELLFAAGDRKRENREGRTPLAVARQVGHARAVELLTALGETAEPPSPAERAITAALAGDEAALAELASANLVFERGEHQVLTWALRHGRQDAVPNLLRIGLDPNVTDDDGRSALVVAQEAGADEAVTVLAAAGATLRSFEFERAPDEAFATFEDAAQAVVDGDLERLTRALDEHEDLVHWRSPRSHRATLLHYLGANGLEADRQKTPPNAVAVLELLLARGAEPDALCATYGGGPAQTTLALLASSGWPAQAGLQRELVRTLCAHGADPNGIDDDGTPLATAISFSCRDAVSGLVDAGARVDNVLFAAATGRVDVVAAEITADGVVRAGSPSSRVDWFWPGNDPVRLAGRALVIAANLNQPAVLALLLERGVDPNSAPQNGETPLHSASYQGHAEIVRTLLEAGADPALRDGNYNSTPFGWALEGKRTEVIDVLREFTLPSLTDAVDCGLVEEAREHLERDPTQVDAPEGRGGLLLWSAQQGRLAMVELLLEFGANRTVTNRQGRTPLELAEAGGHADVARVLRLVR